MKPNRKTLPAPLSFFTHSLAIAIAVALPLNAAVTIEKRFDCPVPNYVANGTYGPEDYDVGYAPSFVGTKVTQDSISRFITGTIRWDRQEYIRYFKEQNTVFGPLGFEIEAHFYNYNDAAQFGFGPAYLLYLTCDPAAMANPFSCGAAHLGFRQCDIPGCYEDTQAFGAKNSLGEYSQPNIAFGSSNASLLNAGRTYFYQARAMSGRGNRSKIKVNFQPTRRLQPYTLPFPVFDAFNQAACEIPGAAKSGDAEIVPFDIEAFAPVCMSSTYKHGGVLRSILFCNP